MMLLNNKERQREICFYLLSNNADASDTLEGIAEWWLLDQWIEFETQNVSEALAKLVSEGLVVEYEEPDPHTVSGSIDRRSLQVTTIHPKVSGGVYAHEKYSFFQVPTVVC